MAQPADADILDLDLVRADVASLEEPLPWCSSWMATGIRHLVRNCDIDCPEHDDLATGNRLDDSARCESPSRYDGAALTRLVNAVPALLAEIDRLRANAAPDVVVSEHAVVRRLTVEQMRTERAALLADAGMPEADLRRLGAAWELKARERGILQRIDGLDWLLSHTTDPSTDMENS